MYYSSAAASGCKAAKGFEDRYLFQRHAMALSAVVTFRHLNKLVLLPQAGRLKIVLRNVRFVVNTVFCQQCGTGGKVRVNIVLSRQSQMSRQANALFNTEL